MVCDKCGKEEGEFVAMGEYRDVGYGEWGYITKNEWVDFYLCKKCFKEWIMIEELKKE